LIIITRSEKTIHEISLDRVALEMREKDKARREKMKCPVCQKEFERFRQMTGHMRIHRKPREMAKEEQSRKLLELCGRCKWYQGNMCLTPKQVPAHWLEELRNDKCSLFEAR